MKITMYNITISPGSTIEYVGTSVLNGVRYKIINIGVKYATIEATQGQHQLSGLPIQRQAFKIKTVDLFETIKCGFYKIIFVD